MSFSSLGGSVTLFGLFLCISDLEGMRTLKNVAVKHGGSVIIPCLYEKQYKANRKFWCSGYYWSSCSIVAYANSHGSISVTDHPAQNIFTVELNPVSDSGTYWCAAEISIATDDRDYLDLTFSQDLSVKESRVSGEEGGSVTVQCLYSAGYQNKQKQWCRLRDKSCNSVGRTETSQNSAVHISDDGKRTFRVQMSGLKKSDAGWYWCSAGDLQVPVHISVGDEAPGLPEKHKDKGPLLNDTILALCIISGLLLVLMMVGLVIWRLKQKHIKLLATNKGYSHSLVNADVVYDTVVSGQPKSDPNQRLKAREDAVTYSTVADGQCNTSSASKPEITYCAVRISHHQNVSPVTSNEKVIYSSVNLQ